MEGLQLGMTIMMQLGSFQFGISTAAYQELTRSTEYRWASQERFGQDAALQFTGPGAETISLPGVIYPEWRGGTGQISAMRNMASPGNPLQMVDGLGAIMGRWCIERIEEKQSIFAAAGVARKQEFTISLRRFPEDLAAAGILSAVASAVAAIGPYASAAGLTTSAASLAGGLGGGLTSALAGINAAVGSAGQSLAPALAAVNRGLNAARSLQTAAAQAERLVRSVTSISSLSEATRVLGGLQAATGGVLSNAMRGSSEIKAFAAKIKGDNEPTNVLAAVNTGLLTINRLAVNVTSIRQKTDAILRGFA